MEAGIAELHWSDHFVQLLHAIAQPANTISGIFTEAVARFFHREAQRRDLLFCGNSTIPETAQ
jgi:hypothetical protein